MWRPSAVFPLVFPSRVEARRPFYLHMSKNQRATVFKIDASERVPSGALRVSGNLTKVGVFDYQLDGETVRELRSDAEVFRPETLDSLCGLPVTIEHPSRFVDTQNWSILSVGSVIGFSVEEPFVSGELLIHDERAIGQIENGGLKEISMGYTTDVVTHDSEVADFAQTNIVYNHAALGPEGWGRLGRDVSLRLDSNSNLIMEDFMSDVEKKDAEAEEAKPETAAPEAPEVVAEDAPAPEPTLADLNKSLGEARATLGKILEHVAAPAAEKTDSVDIDALVAERVERTLKVRDSFAKICPEADASGKSNRELCIEALKRIDSEIETEEASEEVLEAQIDIAAKAMPEPQPDAPSLAERLLGKSINTSAEGFAARMLEQEKG